MKNSYRVLLGFFSRIYFGVSSFMIKIFIFGNNSPMREVGQNLDVARKRVELLQGARVLLKVNEGRNKICCYLGYVEALYPSVFTFRIEETDKVKSFAYSEVQTKNVKFLRPEQS